MYPHEHRVRGWGVPNNGNTTPAGNNWRLAGDDEYFSPSYPHPESGLGWDYNVPTSNSFFPLRDKAGPEGYSAPELSQYSTSNGGEWYAPPPPPPQSVPALRPNDCPNWGFRRAGQGTKRLGERGEETEGGGATGQLKRPKT